MSYEIWLAKTSDKTIAFVGVKRSLEVGRISPDQADAVARLIAGSEGDSLIVVDGHAAQHMVTSAGYRELRPAAPPPRPSPIKPIQDRKNTF